jgi:hypothetical protein
LGFPPSSAPRDYSQRTSGQGQAIEHEPETRFTASAEPPTSRVYLIRATSCRTRGNGTERRAARGAGSPQKQHLRSGCWSAPKAEPTSARAESPWRAMSNPRTSRAGRAQAARPTACAGRLGGKEAKGRPSAICWTLDGKSFVAAAVKVVVARVCLAIVEAGARMRASLTLSAERTAGFGRSSFREQWGCS